MLGGQTMESQTIGGGTFIPIQLDELLLVVAPVFEVLAHTQGTDHLLYLVFQLGDRLVIQVIPMVVRDEEKVDFLGHVLGFVVVRPRKGTIDDRNGRAFIKDGVGKDGLPIQTKQKGTMPKPEVEVARFRQIVQVSLDNGDLTQFWNPILRLFPKEELPKILQQATLTCE